MKTRRQGARPKYDPAPLRSVDSLITTPLGLAGPLTDSASTLDSHHRVRRRPGRWNADRVISFGFASHYEVMGRKFPSLSLGDAGENVIVTTTEIVSFGMIAGGIHVCGDTEALDICAVQPLNPCGPFARYLSGGELDPPQLRRLLAEIGGGMRGFSGRPCGETPDDLTIGADVWIRSGWVRVARITITRSVIKPIRHRIGRLIRSFPRERRSSRAPGS